MAEEVLGIFPCLLQKQPASVYLTTDRLIFHLVGGMVENAQVIHLSSISGFIMNKPRLDLPAEQQKALIKLQYREGDSSQFRDRVLDFTGEERFTNASRCEELLRLHAGDKAEERRMRLKREADQTATRRAEFLTANPEALKMYEYLISPDGGGLTVDEFWDQHKDDSAFVDSRKDDSTIPVPLRTIKDDGLSGPADTLALSDERKEQIFAQFPNVAQLFTQLVPISISEKGFWKRFFHSQYFNLTQGIKQADGATDVIFDSLPIKKEDQKVCLDFEIDLSQETTAEKNELQNSKPYSTLVNRFNASSAANLVDSSSRLSNEADLLNVLNKRRQNSLEEDEVSFSVAKSAIEKLRLVRTKVSRIEPVGDVQRIFIQPGIPGVAANTVAMTTELVANELKKVSSNNKNRLSLETARIDEYLDRVIELGKFFFASKISEKSKRIKLVTNLNKLKLELHQTVIPTLTQSTEWMGTVAMINSIVSNVELFNANLE